MLKIDTIVLLPSSDSPPTAPDQPRTGAFILANSSDFTFPDAAANTAAIETEMDKAKAKATKNPNNTRILGTLARWFPEYAESIVEWLVANGKPNVAAGILTVDNSLGKRAVGRPLDDELRYELARFDIFRREGGYKSRREAALAFCGLTQAPTLQNKLTDFGRAFEALQKPRIVSGPKLSKGEKK